LQEDRFGPVVADGSATPDIDPLLPAASVGFVERHFFVFDN
jgi:hypothetical protein